MVDSPVDQKLLEFIVKSVVSNPDAVQVERKVDEMGVLLSLKVDPNDMAQIIGRQGSMAKALRTILKVAGAKNKARVNLKIEEPAGSSRENREAEKMADGIVDDLKI
ncbi:MAG: KH domain-containing protein [Candidatus Pacebacteria bacterium]|jgi:hypothetical protein|nr:KH domain-containing protein [Candidatus Paceibacterota bacterium]MDD4994391.1 KH domain-containing protein [Candidatus Paceibacterota bacterium]MDD5535096.1 KH domain-containing protein [Candidatus Paceibacterota bacterium]